MHRFSKTMPRTAYRSLPAIAFVLGMLVVNTGYCQRLPKDQLKNGAAVLKAFATVVRLPSQSTVRVMNGNRQVALGAIVGADGLILTKASELKGRPTCRLKDGRELPAQVIGVHRDFDLAMLKIDADDLPVVRWIRDDAIVGQWLVTPGAGELPLAVGVMSVKPRRIPPQSGVLGISISQAESGPQITEVLPHSGAAKAGLKVGDVVTRVAGKVVETGTALAEAIHRFRPGDTLQLLIRRGEKDLQVKAILGHRSGVIPNRPSIQNRMGGRLSTRRAGFPLAIQHDTVLRPEDCGGPLVDLKGRTVGINIARAGRTESFAIPADVILPILDDLRSGKLAPPLPTVKVLKGPPPPPLPE